MRTSLVRLGVFASVLLVFVADPLTAAESLDEQVATARRELEVAKINYRLYWQVEHKRQVRDLDAAIRLTEAEVDILDDRLRRYKRLNDFRYQRPLTVTVQNAELALLEAELRLKCLRGDRLALRRTFGDRCRLMELHIAAVRARLIELERARMTE